MLVRQLKPQAQTCSFVVFASLCKSCERDQNFGSVCWQGLYLPAVMTSVNVPQRPNYKCTTWISGARMVSMCSAVWAAGYTPRSKLVLWCATRNNFELCIDRLNDLQYFSTQLTLPLGQNRCAVGFQLSAAEDLGIAACSFIYTSSIFSSEILSSALHSCTWLQDDVGP
jgi:hypothetical protein